jgi:ectoine hydroxylase-related dioxygenase (phytanoyl-CoA dioxygenase family)
MEEYKEHYTNFDNLSNKLKEDGVAVIENVLNEEEIIQGRQGMWQTLNKLTENLDKPIQNLDHTSWRSLYELYPVHSMLLQHFSIGHSQYVWDIRQNQKVVDVFQKIWDQEELLVSFDGVSVHLPPEITKRGWYRGNDWFHTDQSSKKEGLCCVQGMITLYDVNPGDATLRVMKGSHNYHQDFFTSHNIEEKNDWYKIKPEELDYFDQFEKNSVMAKAGSLILWDSRTFHQGVEPRKERPNQSFRGIVYVCMTPKSWSDNKNILKKQKAFNEMRMTTHWPHKVKLFGKKPRTYGKELPNVGSLDPPVLTNLGQKLAGF